MNSIFNQLLNVKGVVVETVRIVDVFRQVGVSCLVMYFFRV